MAHKKAGGSTTLGRDSQAQRLGTKVAHGEVAKAGSIIVRQRGIRIRPGRNVARGSDDSLFALVTGTVAFTRKKIRRFTGELKQATFVSVVPR